MSSDDYVDAVLNDISVLQCKVDHLYNAQIQFRIVLAMCHFITVQRCCKQMTHTCFFQIGLQQRQCIFCPLQVIQKILQSRFDPKFFRRLFRSQIKSPAYKSMCIDLRKELMKGFFQIHTAAAAEPPG